MLKQSLKKSVALFIENINKFIANININDFTIKIQDVILVCGKYG